MAINYDKENKKIKKLQLTIKQQEQELSELKTKVDSIANLKHETSRLNAEKMCIRDRFTTVPTESLIPSTIPSTFLALSAVTSDTTLASSSTVLTLFKVVIAFLIRAIKYINKIMATTAIIVSSAPFSVIVTVILYLLVWHTLFIIT